MPGRMIRGAALLVVSLVFSFLIIVLHPDPTPKPEEICLNVFMAVRFDLPVKGTAYRHATQGVRASMVVFMS